MGAMALLSGPGPIQSIPGDPAGKLPAVLAFALPSSRLVLLQDHHVTALASMMMLGNLVHL